MKERKRDGVMVERKKSPAIADTRSRYVKLEGLCHVPPLNPDSLSQCSWPFNSLFALDDDNNYGHDTGLCQKTLGCNLERLCHWIQPVLPLPVSMKLTCLLKSSCWVEEGATSTLRPRATPRPLSQEHF